MDNVLTNDLLLDKIFSYIGSIRQLISIERVCKKWQTGSRREQKRRSKSCSFQFNHFYYLFPLETVIPSDNEISYESKPFVFENYEAIKRQLVKCLKENVSFKPNKLLMFNAKFTRPSVWQNAIQLNSIIKYLPHDCQLIHFDSPTIIGTPYQTMVPHPANESLAGISYLLLPNISSVGINVYYDEQIIEHLVPNNDLKCILFFESLCYRKELCSKKYHEYINQVIEKMNYEVAFGGTRVNAIDIIKGNEKSQANKSCAVITFSGKNVKASSVTLRTYGTQTTCQLLTDFKSKLQFDPDDTSSSVTLAFVFCRIIPYRCIGPRYCHFNEGIPSKLIHKIFPKTYFMGTINLWNYGHDFWPEFLDDDNSQERFRKENITQSKALQADTTIIVLINISK